MSSVRINAVAFEEGNAWVAQGIEYDIVARADDVRDIPNAFMRAVMENILITRHLGRSPLQGIKPAPRKFQELFENAVAEMRPIALPNEAPDVSIRLAAA